MKKLLLGIITCTCACVIIGCNKIAADVTILGTTQIEVQESNYFVKLESSSDGLLLHHSVKDVFAINKNSGAIVVIAPIKGMQVTAFAISNSRDIKFIAGETNEKYLSIAFADTAPIVDGLIVVVIIIMIALIVISLINFGRETKSQK